jgi:hypothetical protein
LRVSQTTHNASAIFARFELLVSGSSLHFGELILCAAHVNGLELRAFKAMFQERFRAPPAVRGTSRDSYVGAQKQNNGAG